MRGMLIFILVGLSITNLTHVVANTTNSVGLVAQVVGVPIVDEVTAIVNLGVAGALILVIRWAHLEKTEMRKQQSEWEAQRHADSEKLNETLRAMTRHCAETTMKRG